MSRKADTEIAALMDADATDDRSVSAVIDGAVTVAQLIAVVTRLEDEAYERGYQDCFAVVRPVPPMLP